MFLGRGCLLRWVGLSIDPDAVSVEGHPSARRPPTMFSEIKIDAKDWSNLLRVSSVAKSMLACIHLHPLHATFDRVDGKVFVWIVRWWCMFILRMIWVGKDQC